MDNPTPDSGAKSPHTAHGEAQRQALIRAAFQIIAGEGFEGLRTREVAERVGVNIATLHYYFHSKEDLIRAVVEYLRGVFEHTHTPDLPSSPQDPAAELHQEFADLFYQPEEVRVAIIVSEELYLRAQRDPTIRAMLRNMDDVWHRHIVTYLARGVQEGVFRPDLDIEATAWGIQALVKGSTIQVMLDPSCPVERFHVQIERWMTEVAGHDHHHEHAHEHHHDHEHHSRRHE
ncbi:MAG TPA: TetR family transcriptional regulator C-terminal domain-containing protein [Ktedonobacterales bacterium]|nr:TetR family transcriptional regulator C-terminal domain-containing protein [Ktedonobacterales bacterium]